MAKHVQEVEETVGLIAQAEAEYETLKVDRGIGYTWTVLQPSRPANSSFKRQQEAAQSAVLRVFQPQERRRQNTNASIGLCDAAVSQHHLWHDKAQDSVSSPRTI